MLSKVVVKHKSVAKKVDPHLASFTCRASAKTYFQRSGKKKIINSIALSQLSLTHNSIAKYSIITA